MKPASAKAKGRRLQNKIAGLIQDRFNLSESDVRPAIMGESGYDIKLSSAAMSAFPFALECKNTERLNLWAALEQAEANSDDFLQPAVVFSRNRSKVYIALEFEKFLELINE